MAVKAVGSASEAARASLQGTILALHAALQEPVNMVALSFGYGEKDPHTPKPFACGVAVLYSCRVGSR